MAIDNDKLSYYSGWDIDQLYATAEIPITGSGDTALYTISGDLPPIPEFEVQFKPTGSTNYYQAGAYSTNGTFAAASSFYSYINSGAVFIHAPTAGTARYFVWTDRINY